MASFTPHFRITRSWRLAVVVFVLAGGALSIYLAQWNSHHQPAATPIAKLSASPSPTGTGAVLPTTTVASPTSSPEALQLTPLPDLADSRYKDIAMQLVSSAENSSLNWKAQYAYIQDIDDGRGYTGGIIGFTSGTGDMLEVVQRYTKLKPTNELAAFIPALIADNNSQSHEGLGDAYVAAWKSASNDPLFRTAQDAERDDMYFNPALKQAKRDGLGLLGQFMYYDAIIMHGPGEGRGSFNDIRAIAITHAKTPAQGGNEVAYLNEFLDVRKQAMKREEAHTDTSRVDTAQRVFLQTGNLSLTPPLRWKVYGDTFNIYK